MKIEALFILCCIFNCFAQNQQLPQYGFAHRVNTPSNIEKVLNAGANGIEIDVCYSSMWSNWYVSHNDVGFCACWDCEKLTVWLDTLTRYLKSHPSKTTQLAMLWIDVKTPNDYNINNLPSIIHSAGLPEDIDILYDLAVINEKSKNGFYKIVNKLHDNEGISLKGNSEADVREIYDLYQTQRVTRGTFNQGSSINTDEDLLAYARRCNFMKSSDNPYGFALTLTWTNKKKESIEDHTNSASNYYTDGQIYGNAFDEWSDDAEYIELFNGIIYNSEDVRLATSKDDPFAAVTLKCIESTGRRLLDKERSLFDNINDTEYVPNGLETKFYLYFGDKFNDNSLLNDKASLNKIISAVGKTLNELISDRDSKINYDELGSISSSGYIDNIKQVVGNKYKSIMNDATLVLYLNIKYDVHSTDLLALKSYLLDDGNTKMINEAIESRLELDGIVFGDLDFTVYFVDANCY